MAMFVRFWGTRGSIPTPGRRTHRYGGNTSCVEVRSDDALFVLDGGTGLRELGMDLMRRPQPIRAHLLFSHMHWDHIQGFPFFTPAYLPQNTVCIYGPLDGDRRFHKLLSGQMRSDYFPVEFADLHANILASDLGPTGSRVIDGTTVRVFEQKHPGASYAYSLEKDGKKVVYATDNEVDLTLPDPAAVQDNLAAPRAIPQAFVQFCQGADLIIADGQYLDNEYPQRIGWGHARATTLVDLAVQAGARQLAVFHHDPMHSDEDVDRKIGACRQRAARYQTDLVVLPAREGLTLKL